MCLGAAPHGTAGDAPLHSVAVEWINPVYSMFKTQPFFIAVVIIVITLRITLKIADL